MNFFARASMIATMSLVVPLSALATPITIISSETVSSIAGVPGENPRETDTSTSIPTSTSIVASYGNYRSTTILDWRELSGDTVLGFAFVNERGGSTRTGAGTELRHLDFTVHEDAKYALSGSYALTGDKYIVYGTSLEDLAGGQLFYHDQASEFVTDEHFTLGVETGSRFSRLSGRLTGNLVAGHNYRLWVRTQVFNTAIADDQGETGRGYTTLTISATSVPEPSTLALMAIGLLGWYSLGGSRNHCAAGKARE